MPFLVKIMARKSSKDKNLDLALKFRDYLLFELMGENMGKKPEHEVPKGQATFAEKKAFLDTMLKAAEQGRKSAEDQPEISGLDMIRSRLNGDRTSRGERDFGGESEGGTDESAASTLDTES